MIIIQAHGLKGHVYVLCITYREVEVKKLEEVKQKVKEEKRAEEQCLAEFTQQNRQWSGEGQH